MSGCPAAVRYLPLQSLFLSIFIHLMIFSIFVFTFPVSSISFKPTLIFLGSILHEEDLTTLYGLADGDNTPAQEVLSAAHEELFVSSHEMISRPFGKIIEQKFVFLPSGDKNQVATHAKPTMKTTFPLPVLDASSQAPAATDSWDDHEAVPYKPLRLPER